MSYLLVIGGVACFCCGEKDPGIGLLVTGLLIWFYQNVDTWF